MSYDKNYKCTISSNKLDNKEQCRSMWVIWHGRVSQLAKLWMVAVFGLLKAS